jgi:hypothetical protein
MFQTPVCALPRCECDVRIVEAQQHLLFAARGKGTALLSANGPTARSSS